MTDADIAALRALEEGLWRAETRFDAGWMAQVLAPEFVEFGRSGRRYTRAEIIASATTPSQINCLLPLPDFKVQALSVEIALVTYTSEVRYGAQTERGNRSSIWRRSGTTWQLCFHQGTAVL